MEAKSFYDIPVILVYNCVTIQFVSNNDIVPEFSLNSTARQRNRNRSSLRIGNLLLKNLGEVVLSIVFALCSILSLYVKNYRPTMLGILRSTHLGGCLVKILIDSERAGSDF